MADAIAEIRALRDVSAERFREEIIPAGVPVVLKGLVSHWPAVQEGENSPEAIVDYVRRFDAGQAVETVIGRPEIGGKFFYNASMDGLNFAKMPESIGESAKRILAFRAERDPPSIYVQSASIAEFLPGFEQENRLEHVDASAAPRIWMANRVTVQTHFDLKDNLACVVAGRRRFTLFPPAETPNLYPGPFELTLAGPPVSMVRLDEPDYERYPNFRQALAAALTAELEPGDAIYIPYFWWHHVRALEDINILVNYWWNDTDLDLGSPFDAMLHALLAIRDLPPRQRDAWQTMFDHYVFQRNGDPVAHLAPEARGRLGAHNAFMRLAIRKNLIESIARQAGFRLSSIQPSTPGK
jgi:hypothetical protein